MVLHVCGESISVPTYISKWVEESEDNQIEFRGMIESIVWAAKKSVAKDELEESIEEHNEGFSEFMSAYKDLLSTLFGGKDDSDSNNDDEKDKS